MMSFIAGVVVTAIVGLGLFVWFLDRVFRW